MMLPFPDRFNHVSLLKALFQGAPYRMTLDEVVTLTNAFTNSLDIHSCDSGPCLSDFPRLTLEMTGALPTFPIEHFIHIASGPLPCSAYLNAVNASESVRQPLTDLKRHQDIGDRAPQLRTRQ